MAEVPRPTINAVYKRQEQLRRWNDSETNRESAELKRKHSRIKFPDGCVFLAACSAGDIQEVENLLARGADINTTNVDGLTALHQACIDDNMKMVRYLVENGADINTVDNEGWTPLHAAASCGYTKIAKYLLEHGSRVAAVNNDGELPIDIADGDEMEHLLRIEQTRLGIDAEAARNEEETRMLADANQWLNTGLLKDKKHPKSGASALHVAAAKGYIKVINILIQAGAKLDETDVDGWTPLHAAAHWGQKETCQILAMGGCNMGARNIVGQTAFDVADEELLGFLEELKKKQATLEKKPEPANIIPRKIPPPLKRRDRSPGESDNQCSAFPVDNSPDKSRSSVNRMSVHDKTTASQKELQEEAAAHVQLKLKNMDSVEDEDDESGRNKNSSQDGTPKLADQQSIPLSTVTIMAGQTLPASESSEDEEENSSSSEKETSASEPESEPIVNDSTQVPFKSNLSRLEPSQEDTPETPEERDRRLARPGVTPASAETHAENRLNCPVSQRLADRILSQPYSVLTRKIMAKSSLPPSSATTTTITTTTTSITTTSTAVPSSLNRLRQRLHELTTDNGSLQSGVSVRRSFVPPTPDEESETVRKAKSRHARQTRRSTQGVTAEDVAEAQQQLSDLQKLRDDKKRQEEQSKKVSQNPGPRRSSRDDSEQKRKQEEEQRKALEEQKKRAEEAKRRVEELRRKAEEARRKFDDERKKKEEAEEKKRKEEDERRRQQASNSGVPQGTALKLTIPANTPSQVSPNAARRRLVVQAVPDTPEDSTTSVTLPFLRRKSDDKEDDKIKKEQIDEMERKKELQAKRRQRVRQRRGTGTVALEDDDDDDVEAEKQATDSKNLSNKASRISKPMTIEDYKKLVEEKDLENLQLKGQLQKSERELQETKKKLDQATALKNGSIGSITRSDSDKKEKRALDRKLSEMEEQLKLSDITDLQYKQHLQTLKTEHAKLKDENRALTRVVARLTK